MADGWKSKSESQGGTPISLPQPSESGDGNKTADVMTSNPQWGHGKFGQGDWDPSTSKPAPSGSGWDSKSEDLKPDNKGHLK